MKICKHIEYNAEQQIYLVHEPATIEPFGNGENMRCSKCKKNVPIMKRENGAMRIRLVPRGKTGREDGYSHKYTVGIGK